MLSILAAPLHLRLVVGLRERLFLSSQVRARSVGGEVKLDMLALNRQLARCSTYLGAVVGSLKHNRAVAEFLDQAVLSLDGFRMLASLSLSINDIRKILTRIRDLGNLVALETVPALVTASIHELQLMSAIDLSYLGARNHDEHQ